MTSPVKRHNLTFLVHEKPFAGINGSGKPNNWSMAPFQFILQGKASALPFFLVPFKIPAQKGETRCPN